MSVKLNSTGGGSVTLDSPSTASNYTITLPSAAGTLATTTGTLASPTITGTVAGGATYTSPTLTGASITAANSNTVEATSGPTSSQLAGNRNKIINGRMEINQRGVTSGVFSGYFLDRWGVSGVTTTGLITSSLPTGYAQAISVNRTSASGTAVVYQRIESTNCFDLAGNSATVSFWAQNVTGLSSITVTLSYATAVDNFASTTAINTVTVSSSPSASWTYYTATFSSLPASTTNGLQLAINGTTASTGTLGVTGVQLEKGATATPFENRLYGTELALCQRYCINYNSANANGPYTRYTYGECNSTTQITGNIYVPFPMRVTPSLTTTSTASNYCAYSKATVTAGSAVPAIGPDGSTNQTVQVYLNVASGLIQGNAGAIMSNNNNTSYLLFTAEL